MMIRNDSKLFTFGQNNYGQLGDSTYLYRSYPSEFLFNNIDTVDVSVGLYHALILKSGGMLSGIGSNNVFFILI
jgi:alpha-tubulin suppressor-like RCC1 family protein